MFVIAFFHQLVRRSTKVKSKAIAIFIIYESIFLQSRKYRKKISDILRQTDITTTNLFGSVCSSWDYPSADPVMPCSSWKSSIAAHTTGITTWNEIIRRKPKINFTFWVDANSVRHGFYSSKCLERMYSIYLIYINSSAQSIAQIYLLLWDIFAMPVQSV